MNVTISVVIPIKNEASNLPRCLASIAWADEIWVVDSNSLDGSREIVEAEDRRRKTDVGGRTKEDGGQWAESGRTAGQTFDEPEAGVQTAEVGGPVHFVQFRFNGTWPKKKNWALENLPFKHEWVFILDADEELSPQAEHEIRRIVNASDSRSRPVRQAQGASGDADDIVGYWINRRFMFMGKWLKHAYYPNWNLRLFKHRLGRYEKLTEVDTASGDNEVHEHVIVQGRTARLRCEMNHYAFPSVDVFVEKHNRYSNWEARVAMDRFLKRSSTELQAANVGWRRRIKVWSHRLPFRPFLRFCYVFVWQRGFLDGWEGYYFARLHGMYELLCVAKTYELAQSRQRPKSN